MPLTIDRLDRYKFDQLIEEGRVLLPDLAPGWSDYNFHDPGVTLMELFAWLTESDIYRLDRTPPATQRAFLRLLGIEVRPQQAAETVLAFETALPDATTHLSAGSRVSDAGGRVVFQTVDDLDVSPARLTAVLSGSLNELAAHDLGQGRSFYAFGDHPRPGDALYLGFDRPLAHVPTPAKLYLWTGDPATDKQICQQLQAEWAITHAQMNRDCPPDSQPSLRDWRLHYSARTSWEFYGQNGQWLPLEEVTDETRALTLSGGIGFTTPAETACEPGGVPGQKYTELYFIRCRLVSGGYDCPPQIEHVALNTVRARHAVDCDMEPLHSDGRAGQSFRLEHAPIVPGSVQLKVLLDGHDTGDWREAADWDRAGPHDRTALLLPETGTIAFGDGRSGRVPPAGGKICITYQSGGGPAGNLPAQSLVKSVPERNDVQVSQPYAAEGGELSERLVDAIGRALDWLAARHRAVTLDDFTILAREAPGVPVGRSYAIPYYYPRLPCIYTPGCVTVVIVPDCAGTRPSPSAAMCQFVQRYLERRRTVTAEVHVIGPAYTTIAVSARLHPRADADTSGLVTKANVRLNAFFDPLHGGPQGTGWPVGREVVEPEIMALLNALPGVDFVDGVSLKVEGLSDPTGGELSLWYESGVGAKSSIFHVKLLTAPDAAPQALEEAIKAKLDQIARRLLALSAGYARQAVWDMEEQDMTAYMRRLEGVLAVEEFRLLAEREHIQTCGVVSICPHGLTTPGEHQIIVEDGGKCDE